MFPWQRNFFLSDNIFFFLNCHSVLDNQSGEKKIELQWKQNIFNKTMCFYGINSTYLLPWQPKFLCHIDFVHKLNNYKTIMLLITLFSDCRHEIYLKKKVREKSRECHNHKLQPFLDTKRKRKPTNLNKHKSKKRTKSTKISSLSSPREVIATQKGPKTQEQNDTR